MNQPESCSQKPSLNQRLSDSLRNQQRTGGDYVHQGLFAWDQGIFSKVKSHLSVGCGRNTHSAPYFINLLQNQVRIRLHEPAGSRQNPVLLRGIPPSGVILFFSLCLNCKRPKNKSLG